MEGKHRQFRFLVAAVVMALIGCSRPTTTLPTAVADAESPISLTGDRYHHPVMLKSELAEPISVSSSAVLTNRRPTPLTIGLEWVGCSCSQVDVVDPDTGDVKTLSAGQEFALAGGHQVTLRTTVRVKAVSDHFVTGARYVARDATGGVFPFESFVNIEFQSDLVATPSVLSHQFTASGPQEAEQQWTIDVYSRSENCGTLLPTAPGGVTLTGLRAEPATRLPSGLWLTRWSADVTLTRPHRLADLPFAGLCQLALSGDSAPAVHVPVRMTLGEGITVAPDHVNLGDISVGQVVSRKVRLRAADDVKFRVEKATCTSRVLTASAHTHQEASEQWVEVLLTPTLAGDHEATVRLCTTHPQAAEVTLSVRFDAREK